MSYCEDAAYQTYRASLDISDISDETMTDYGVPVRDLQPIHDCSLAPGDPSPIGRTEDGDLAYPVFETESYIKLERRVTADLAHLYAKAHGFTQAPKHPFTRPEEMIFYELLTEAVPQILFGDSNHQALAYEAAVTAVISGDWENYPKRFSHPVS